MHRIQAIIEETRAVRVKVEVYADSLADARDLIEGGEFEELEVISADDYSNGGDIEVVKIDYADD